MQARHFMVSAALGLAMMTMPALAENRVDGVGWQGMVSAIQAAEFGAIDTDGDGRISPAEWAAFIDGHRAAMRARNIEARVEALFEIGDANGDGQLSRDELAAAMAMLQEERQARLAAWREAGRQIRDEMRGQQRPRAEGERGMRGEQRPRAEGERGMRGKGMPGRAGCARPSSGPRQHAENMFRRIDTDGDGHIDPEEFAAARERWAEGFKRIERRMEGGRVRDGRARANSAD